MKSSKDQGQLSGKSIRRSFLDGSHIAAEWHPSSSRLRRSDAAERRGRRNRPPGTGSPQVINGPPVFIARASIRHRQSAERMTAGALCHGPVHIMRVCATRIWARSNAGHPEPIPQRPALPGFPGDVDKMHKEIDAVSVGIRDFSHFPSMLAMSQGETLLRKAHGPTASRQLELMMAARRIQSPARWGNQASPSPTISNSRRGSMPASSKTSPRSPRS